MTRLNWTAAWRLAVLAALLWIGWELHSIQRKLPAGVSYQTERDIRSMAEDMDRLARKLAGPPTVAPLDYWDRPPAAAPQKPAGNP